MRNIPSLQNTEISTYAWSVKFFNVIKRMMMSIDWPQLTFLIEIHINVILFYYGDNLSPLKTNMDASSLTLQLKNVKLFFKHDFLIFLKRLNLFQVSTSFDFSVIIVSIIFFLCSIFVVWFEKVFWSLTIRYWLKIYIRTNNLNDVSTDVIVPNVLKYVMFNVLKFPYFLHNMFF